MNADQTNLAYQLILVINVFLRLVDRREEKPYACYHIGKAISEAVRGWLTRHS